MKKYIVVVVLLFMACLCHAEKVTIRIVGEDVSAGFTAKHTSLIQQAIDSCYAHSDGGCVILSEGVYTTGTLFLKSNVELRLEIIVASILFMFFCGYYLIFICFNRKSNGAKYLPVL